MGEIMNVLKRANLSPDKTDFQLECSLEFTIRLNQSDSILKKLNEIDDTEAIVISLD